MLGAMLVSEGAITPVIVDVRLHAEDFYRDRHRAIFARDPHALREERSRSTR